jgi:hypothetical protein
MWRRTRKYAEIPAQSTAAALRDRMINHHIIRTMD